MSLIISESTPGLAKSAKRYADATENLAMALEGLESQRKRMTAAEDAYNRAMEAQALALTELQNHFGGMPKAAKAARARP